MRAARTAPVAALAAALVLAAAASAKLTPPEQRWAAPIVRVYNTVNTNLHLLSGEERAANALIAGSGRNNSLLTASLVVLASCQGEVAHAGGPPTARLRSFQADMLAGCGHLATGALDVAHAIGEIRKGSGALARSALLASEPELVRGSQLLAAAAKRLLALGGTHPFVA